MVLQERWLGPWSLVILCAAFVYMYVGPNPLSGDSVDLVEVAKAGNRLNQLARVTLFLGAVPLFVLQIGRCLDLAKSLAPLILLYAWFVASIIWSDHPDLTARRLISDGLLLFMLVSVVSTGFSVRNIFLAFLAAVIAVFLLNLASIVVFPGVALSDLGVRGIYTQKNTAGTFALICCITVGGAIFSARDLRVRAAMAVMWLLVVLFLYVTNSKTSLGIAALVVGTAPLLYLVHVSGTALSFAAVTAAATSIAAFVALLSLFDVSREAVLAFAFGDPTLTQRTAIWSALLTNIQDRPLLGAGWAAFWDVGNTLNPIDAPANVFFRDASLINTAHNGYIDIVVQAGLVGLALKLLFIVRFLYVFSRLLRAEGFTVFERRIVATFMSLGVAIVINDLTESLILRPGDPFGFTFVFVYVVGEWLHRRRAQGLGSMTRPRHLPRLKGDPHLAGTAHRQSTSGFLADRRPDGRS